MGKRNYRPSSRLLSDQAARRHRDREEAQAHHDREYTYWREPGGRLVNFSSEWSSMEIREYKEKAWARYREQHGSPQSAPSSHEIVEHRRAKRYFDWGFVIIILGMLGVIVLGAIVLPYFGGVGEWFR